MVWEEKMSISEVSRFSILPNQKLGNLRKFSFSSIFYRFGCIKLGKDLFMFHSRWRNVFSTILLKKTCILVNIHLTPTVSYHNMVISWKLYISAERKKHIKRLWKTIQNAYIKGIAYFEKQPPELFYVKSCS